MSVFNTLVSENYKYAEFHILIILLYLPNLSYLIYNPNMYGSKIVGRYFGHRSILGFTSDFRITIVEFYFFLDFGMEFEYSFDHFLAHKNN